MAYLVIGICIGIIGTIIFTIFTSASKEVFIDGKEQKENKSDLKEDVTKDDISLLS